MYRHHLRTWLSLLRQFVNIFFNVSDGSEIGCNLTLYLFSKSKLWIHHFRICQTFLVSIALIPFEVNAGQRLFVFDHF